jgi:pimeloyl-ACP methyl ester carboxylesterase
VKRGFCAAGGHRLEYVEYPARDAGRPALVFLHEGLGSVSLWRDFPGRVAHATGLRTLVYSRYGYGQSDVLAAPRRPDYMHVEALATLPEVLRHFGIERPILVGHSDGGSIALIHAGAGHACTGIAVLAPHLFVEDMTVPGIEATVRIFASTDLPQKLARHHRDVVRTFNGWADIWRHPDFRAWNIESCLPGIRCPVLAIQGEGDEYASMAHIDRIRELAVAAPGVELLKLADCGHSPHRDQASAVAAAVAAFALRLAQAVPA